MESKTFEIRDSGTLIPVLAIKLVPGNEPDCRVLHRAGYGETAEAQANYVQLAIIAGGRGPSTCNPYDWSDWLRKTMQPAHQYIIDHFNALESGAVVDSEFIRGEATGPRSSDCALLPARGVPPRKFSPSESSVRPSDDEVGQRRSG